jgi:hypothetical protein
MSKRTASISLTVAWLLGAAPALAHIELLDPVPRAYGQSEGNLKKQPCGQTVDGRTDRVDVLRPGQTIVVRWNEFVNHESYFRIAFEMDGDDFVQRPPQNLSAAMDDPVAEEAAIDTGQLLAVVADTGTGEHSATVTVPTQECENCTLQLIQFMYGRADSYYYQCADIAIRSDGASGTGGSGTAGGAGGNGATFGTGGPAGAGGTPLFGESGGGAVLGATGGASLVGDTGGTLDVGATGGAGVVGDNGGAPDGGGTDASDGVGGTTSIGATGGRAKGGTPLASGGAFATTGGVSSSTGGAGTGAAPAASETGGEWALGFAGSTAEPDASADSSRRAQAGGSCASARSTPSQTGGLGWAAIIGVALIRRRSWRGAPR